METIMVNHAAAEWRLPCRAERQKIVEQANLVLAKARAVAEQSDQSLALLSAAGPLGAQAQAGR